jgi:hypothetical protein
MKTVIVRLEHTGPVAVDDFVKAPSGKLVQVCRATVASDSSTEPIAIFVPAHFDEPLGAIDTLAALTAAESAGTVGVLLRAYAEGRAMVEASPVHETRALVIAAAVAVMRVGWGWDESAAIVVGVNAVSITVEPRFEGTVWIVSMAT